MEDKINKPFLGLNTDNNYSGQPENTYSFALNTVNESNDGDFQNLSNENSNDIYAYLKPDFVLIGSVYIGDGETCLFSVKNDNSESEIGILSEKQSVNNTETGNNYKVWCNDKLSDDKNKLNFRVDKQIQAVYKLRRGCEKTVYWTDNYNFLRSANLNDIDNYLQENNKTQLEVKNFKHIKNTPLNTTPIKNINILNSGGDLEVGSIKVLFRYLDKYENYTPFFYESVNYLIYKDDLTNDYNNIYGDFKFKSEDLLKTKKSLQLEFDFSDTEYKKFQLAFVVYKDSIGTISEILYSNVLSTKLKKYIFTGKNYLSKGTYEELVLNEENNKIKEVKTITFKDDRLILGNVKSSYEDYSEVQKIASRIKSDCIFTIVENNVLNQHSPKFPEQHEVGVGCSPEEIVSLALSVVLEDGVETPLFHIPGPTGSEQVLDTEYQNDTYKLFPLDRDVINENLFYSKKNSCDKQWFYQRDYLGNVLDSTKNVRFHKIPAEHKIISRFGLNMKPTKSKVYLYKNNSFLNRNELLNEFNHFEEIEVKNENEEIVGKNINYKDFHLEFTINYKTSSMTTAEDKVYKVKSLENLFSFEELLQDTTLLLKDGVKIVLIDKTYTVRKTTNKTGSTETFEYFDNEERVEQEPTATNGFTKFLTETIVEKDDTTEKVEILIYNLRKEIQLGSTTQVFLKSEFNNEFKYKDLINISLNTTIKEQKVYKNIVTGIHLSNIKFDDVLIEGKKIIGYNIYKQKVTENDKYFLDSIFLIPTVEKNDYVGGQPYQDQKALHRNSVSSDVHNRCPQDYNQNYYNVLSMKHKFRDETFSNFSKIIITDYVSVSDVGKDAFFYQDVRDADDGVNGNSAYSDDGDGLDFKMLCRDVFFSDTKSFEEPIEIPFEEVDFINLQPYEYFYNQKDRKTILNMDYLNKNLFVRFDNPSRITSKGKVNSQIINNQNQAERYYYKGYIIRENKTIFENLEVQSFQKINSVLQTKESFSTFKFNGYSGLFNYTTANYTKIISKTSINKGTIGHYLGSVISVVVGLIAVGLAVFTGGLSVLLTLGLGGVLLTASGVVSGIKAIKHAEGLLKITQDFWDKGASNIATDPQVYAFAYGLTNEHEVRFGQDNILVYSGWSLNDIYFKTDFNFTLTPRFGSNGQVNLLPITSNEHFIAWKKFEQHDHNTGRGCGLCNSGRNNGENISLATLCSFYYRKGNGNGNFSSVFLTKHLNRDWTNPDSVLSKFFKEKVLKQENKRNEGLELIDIETNEYITNLDFDYLDNIKKNYLYQLPITCAKCEEEYPQRFYWSGIDNSENYQSNLTQFKPNDYKDVSGEYGEITNIFTFNNNLYIHTTEGLWVQPTNPQEQLLNDVTLYIGTGEFGSLPPQLIIDDRNGTSAGLQHREAQIMTPYGYFFVSERERKVYKFDGKLEPISDKGMTKWFNENIPLTLNRQYRKNNGEEYKYNDNPANFLGTGFILVYDKERERIIVTKKDYIFGASEIENQNYEICLINNKTYGLEVNKTKAILSQLASDEKKLILSKATKFTNIDGTELSLNERPTENNIFSFVGIENCEMKFETWIEIEKEIKTKKLVKNTIQNDTVIFFYYDTSGSMNANDHIYIKNSFDIIKNRIIEQNPSLGIDSDKKFIQLFGIIEYVGRIISELKAGGLTQTNGNILEKVQNSYIYHEFESVSKTYYPADLKDKNIILVTFVNEDGGVNSDNSLNNVNLINTFEEKYLSYFKSFKIINYPIPTNSTYIVEGGGGTFEMWKGFYRTFINNMSSEERTAFTNKLFEKRNNAFLEQQWNDLKTKFLTYEPEVSGVSKNPYKDWGWRLIMSENTYVQETLPSLTESIINNVLEAIIPNEETFTEIEETVNVKELKQVYIYIPGQELKENIIVNNGWTISYSLKYNTWTSFHSYQPNFYFRMNEKHFSWVNGNRNIYLHNKLNHYQTFYGKHYPHIIEYVDNNNPLVTKIFDHIRLLTDAQRYDTETKEHYDERWITFNKAILYNSRQCSGELNLKVKDITPQQEFYLSQQVVNENNNVIFLDRNERDWLLNDFRDYRINYNKPIFNSDKTYISNNYDKGYIDKIINEDTIDLQKDWYDLESLRDKYLVVRLSFDNFADVKIIFNFNSNYTTQSNY